MDCTPRAQALRYHGAITSTPCDGEASLRATVLAPPAADWHARRPAGMQSDPLQRLVLLA